MRIFRLIAASAFLAAIAVLPAYAQQRPATPAQTPAPTANVPDTKIAFVNTEAFRDDKAGIARYVNAVKTLEREFAPRQQELQTLATRIKAIADEINKLGSSSVVDPKTVQAKQDEGEGLKRQFDFKQKEYEAAAQKRYEEVVGPISEDIGKALDAFANRRGFSLVLDIGKLYNAGAILSYNPAMDVTQAFIAEYNSSHPATASTAAPGRE